MGQNRGPKNEPTYTQMISDRHKGNKVKKKIDCQEKALKQVDIHRQTLDP
jgi:hypothetical protein